MSLAIKEGYKEAVGSNNFKAMKIMWKSALGKQLLVDTTDSD